MLPIAEKKKRSPENWEKNKVASRKQKQELIEALKFTPRDIEISFSGYGGEIVIGRISEEAYDFWEGREDIGDYVYDWDGEFDVPADANFCPDAAWHDVDDLCHESGCEASDGCWITVEDILEGKTIFESSTDIDVLSGKGVDTSNYTRIRPEETEPDGQSIFLGQSFEKGTFFSGTVRINRPFDPSKLSISWTDCDGWRLISGVEYDGEEVDGYGAYSTTGKGTEFRVYQVEGNDQDLGERDIPVLDGEEMWASQVIDDAAEVERWKEHDLTPWWPAAEKPIHEGRYQVLLGNWPFPSFAEYSRKKGWRQYDEKIENLVSWRGLSHPAE